MSPDEKENRQELSPDLKPEFERFEKFLRLNQLRMTCQRKAILREVFRYHGHIDADELSERVRKIDRAASRATVYRTLDLLAQAGLVKNVGLGRSQKFFEHVHHGEHHDHLVCESCGEIIEFFSSELENCQSAVCDEHDFLPKRHTMVIFGLCGKCRKKKS
ncbi:MAG TPA: transcriptional repressor [Firmicutes bacterium]|nr:transcriptional repressor [Bacillota bacterium]